MSHEVALEALAYRVAIVASLWIGVSICVAWAWNKLIPPPDDWED